MILSLSDMTFRSADKVLELRLVPSKTGYRGYPSTLEVTSPHTGRTVVFSQDNDSAIKNEFWDGELMEYIPETRLPNVAKIVAWYDYGNNW